MIGPFVNGPEREELMAMMNPKTATGMSFSEKLSEIRNRTYATSKSNDWNGLPYVKGGCFTSAAQQSHASLAWKEKHGVN